MINKEQISNYWTQFVSKFNLACLIFLYLCLIKPIESTKTLIVEYQIQVLIELLTQKCILSLASLLVLQWECKQTWILTFLLFFGRK